MWLGYFGDATLTDVVAIPLPTVLTQGGPGRNPDTNWAAGDISLYKSVSGGAWVTSTLTTAIAVDTGIGSNAGVGAARIDTGDNTGHAGFWEANSEILMVTEKDVNGTPVLMVASFSVQNRA